MAWNPSQYERFQNERNQPFFDLLDLVQPKPDMKVIDLGCGTGELTLGLHQKLAARETLGIDSSSTMLERALAFAAPGLTFRQAEIESLAWGEGYDLVFSNAALHWVPDNPAVLAHIAAVLGPRGQIAVQVPANDDHPSHRVAGEVGLEEPFRSALGGFERKSNILAPERYAALLDELGFDRQHVRLQVYVHHLPSRDDVIEWVKGTTLLAYQKRMPDELYARFLSRFRERLFEELPDARPFFYSFKRILFWGQRKA
jgi:trans-aconitate 2-methyltransferase